MANPAAVLKYDLYVHTIGVHCALFFEFYRKSSCHVFRFIKKADGYQAYLPPPFCHCFLPHQFCHEMTVAIVFPESSFDKSILVPLIAWDPGLLHLAISEVPTIFVFGDIIPPPQQWPLSVMASQCHCYTQLFWRHYYTRTIAAPPPPRGNILVCPKLAW